MTLAHWDKIPSLQTELKAILQDPTLMAALEIVKNMGVAPVAPPPLGVNLMHFSALVGARKEGFVEALSNLRILSQSAPAKTLALKPWERAAAEELQEKPQQPK